MRRPFTGCGTALVTPFTRDGSLDEAGVSRLARRQIDAGIHFLVPCGTTGEVPTLTDDEQVRVVELVVEEAKGRVPGARRCRRLQHARSDRSRQADESGRRRRAAVGDAVLQQADAGRAVSALQGHRRGRRPADRRLQRPGPNRRQRRPRDAGPAGARSRRSSPSRKRRATSRRCARSAPPCRRTSSCSRATMR